MVPYPVDVVSGGIEAVKTPNRMIFENPGLKPLSTLCAMAFWQHAG